MQCPRCKKEFPLSEMGSIPVALRLFSFPFAWRSARVRKEMAARYCYLCRRSVNAALFFILFAVVVIAVTKAVQKFG